MAVIYMTDLGNANNSLNNLQAFSEGLMEIRKYSKNYKEKLETYEINDVINVFIENLENYINELTKYQNQINILITNANDANHRMFQAMQNESKIDTSLINGLIRERNSIIKKSEVVLSDVEDTDINPTTELKKTTSNNSSNLFYINTQINKIQNVINTDESASRSFLSSTADIKYNG